MPQGLFLTGIFYCKIPKAAILRNNITVTSGLSAIHVRRLPNLDAQICILKKLEYDIRRPRDTVRRHTLQNGAKILHKVASISTHSGLIKVNDFLMAVVFSRMGGSTSATYHKMFLGYSLDLLLISPVINLC